MVSSSFFIFMCGVLLISTEALRFGNRNGPGGPLNTQDGQENGEQNLPIGEQENGEQNLPIGGEENGLQDRPVGEQENGEQNLPIDGEENGQQDRPIGGPKGDGGDQDGMHGHGHGIGGGLPFLANMTDEERSQFFTILKDRTLNKASKEAAIDKLMATLDPAIQEAYNTWKQEKEAALAEKVAALSPEAKAAYDALQQIFSDTTLSAEEMWMKVREFFNKQTDEVRKELQGLMWGGKGGFGGDKEGVEGGRFGGSQGGSGDNENRFRSKRRSGFNGGLSFLSNITDPTILAQFRAIFKNRALDKAAKDSAIEALVATLDPAIQQAYNTWKAEREAALAAKVAALSPEAKTAYDSLKAIKDNTALSAEEKKTQIKALLDTLTQAVRDELKTAFGGHHGGRGQSGGSEQGGLVGNGGFGRAGRGFGSRS